MDGAWKVCVCEVGGGGGVDEGGRRVEQPTLYRFSTDRTCGVWLGFD